MGKMLKGEKEFLGRGVSYCATCDEMLYRGKKVAVIGYSKREEAEAEFLAEVVDQVYYFSMYNGEVSVSEKIEVVREVPKSVFGKDLVEGLRTDKCGSTVGSGISGKNKREKGRIDEGI